MEILEWTFKALLIILSAAVFLVMSGVVVMLILGLFGIGVCDIEYDEKDDRTDWPDPLA